MSKNDHVHTPTTAKLRQMVNEEPGSKKFWKILLTMGGAGYAPYAPGTAGAIVALAIGILIINYAPLPFLLLFILIAGFTVIGIKGSNLLQEEWGKDSKRIVIDEAVGMWISMLFITNSWFMYLIAFAFFRFFDIAKPLGIRKLDNVTNGTGVMADDILAGIYSMIMVQAVLLILMITI